MSEKLGQAAVGSFVFRDNSLTGTGLTPGGIGAGVLGAVGSGTAAAVDLAKSDQKPCRRPNGHLKSPRRNKVAGDVQASPPVGHAAILRLSDRDFARQGNNRQRRTKGSDGHCCQPVHTILCQLACIQNPFHASLGVAYVPSLRQAARKLPFAAGCVAGCRSNLYPLPEATATSAGKRGCGNKTSVCACRNGMHTKVFWKMAL